MIEQGWLDDNLIFMLQNGGNHKMTVYLTKYGWKPETRVVNDEVITSEEMKIREVLSLKEKYLS